jgi:hypothetical protein
MLNLTQVVVLGALVVIVLATGPKVGSNAAEEDGFLQAIQIRSTTSF